MSTPGRALVAQIDSLAVPPGMLAIWGLGQSGFILKGGQTVAYLDPYLTNAVPMHNDMFALNHASPAVLADFLDRHYPRQRYHWLQPGELYLYVRGPRGSTDPP